MVRTGRTLGFIITILILSSFIPIFPASTSNQELDNVEPTSKLSSDLDAPLAIDPENIGLIVQFRSGPSGSDEAFVRQLGFRILRTFHFIPALSIYGPTGKLDNLISSDRVTFIEHNDPVVIDMEMGTWVINATEVWSRIVRTEDGDSNPIDGAGVTVCVVDTGIDAGHPDLDYQTKTVKNVYDVGGGRWLESENTDTNYGHGTHVAGTVAGNGDASAGARRGVAPGANLIGITVSIPEEGSTPTEDGYIQGLEWVYDNSMPNSNPHNIRVVTNSWHSTVGEYDPNAALTQMIEKLAFENNVVSTWSAGNDGRDDPEGNTITTSGQGNTPVGIVVAAYERDGSAVTDFSSRGQVGLNHTYPDIGAPGRSIWSASARRTIISAGSYCGGTVNPY
jgi:serine protease AprX